MSSQLGPHNLQPIRGSTLTRVRREPEDRVSSRHSAWTRARLRLSMVPMSFGIAAMRWALLRQGVLATCNGRARRTL
jgi:hypothetical protein